MYVRYFCLVLDNSQSYVLCPWHLSKVIIKEPHETFLHTLFTSEVPIL